MDINYFLKINNAFAIENKRDIAINRTRNQISRNFNSNVQTINVEINDEPRTISISSSTKNNILTISTSPDQNDLLPGDSVRWDKEIWLVTEKKPNNIFISQAIMEKCNFDLKWIDSEGSIQTYPSVLYFNARSNFGTEEDKTMNLPAGRRQITIQSNEHTVKIRRDVRFIVGNEAFKVIDTDFMSDDGLVNLSLQSDQIDPVKDNLELGIADYHKLSKYELLILNDNPLSLSINQTARINVRVMRNGSEISDPQIVYSSSNTDLISVDEQGIITIHESGETNVTVSAYGIEKQLNIYVAPTIHYDYAATIDGANDIYLNRESTYVASFYNNGIKISDESSFSLTNLDGSPTLLASISSQDPIANTCTVKANSNRKLGTVILHVKNANGLSNGQREIKIKSLI
ncbi:hypothetical protein HUB98_06350 [Paenibacillus barcinonensis]|uniref:Ig-like protein group 2 n=1 Tax=Paenibacillus barcinonensis TaxID=198119 RepID=A0A2V4VDU9_PAEBA|nr:hypothetical protein [Paenibacillus barcinonensis]PYE51638.1 hypothetical protein DFQ00_102433 [Paenibacillus barcinonensis]QKS56000.1 hypothetical protein HUB98_06350 [Paenibacillus barcinonensis]